MKLTMDKVGCEMICKNHSARSERDHFRVCPTKLTKCELEDLYFALLEQNLQLKKTVNSQQDRIKVLSTKVQRMASTQKCLRADENKTCCAATKAAVNHQKDMIADLKRANERMADRIRKLNMRLCSAKQFCKSATPTGLRCSTATSPYLIKHSPHSYKQQSHSTLKLAVSCHNLSRDTLVTKCVQTEPCESAKRNEQKKPCDDNKCKTMIDELKEKIANLEEKLSCTKAECISLEGSLRDAREASARACAQRVTTEKDLQLTEQRNSALTIGLRAAEGLSGELKTQLSIEKRKVAELETRLKVATMSNQVTKSIEDTLTSIQESNKTAAAEVTITCTCCSPRSKTESSIQQTSAGLSPGAKSNLSKSMEDSGYMDSNKSQSVLDDQSLNKIIDELTKRIVVLQTQVDAMTISPPEANAVDTRDYSLAVEELNTGTENTLSKLKQGKTTRNENDKENIKTTDTDSDETKSKSTVHEQHSLQVPGPVTVAESSQTGNWKRNAAKLTLVVKKTKDKDSASKETAQKQENNGLGNDIMENNKDNDGKNKQNVDLSKDNERIIDVSNIDKNKDKGLQIKETTSSTEDKTYNILEKDKKNLKKDENASDKDKIYLEEKVKKSVSKEKVNQNDIVSPVKNRSIGGKANKTEQKSHLGRFETFARGDTEARNMSTCSEATYTVDCENNSRATSPDNTDYEISSMTDLTDEKDIRSPTMPRLSPGEQKYPITHSDSYPSTNYSLSEGEIHVNTVRRRSYDDKSRAQTSAKATVPKMEETLQAITDELARCKRLLFSQRSRDNTMPAVGTHVGRFKENKIF